MVQSVLRGEIADHCWGAQAAAGMLELRLGSLKSHLEGAPAPAGLEALNNQTSRHLTPQDGSDEMRQIVDLKIGIWEPVATILESCTIVGRTLFPSGAEPCVCCGRTASEPSGYRQERAGLVLEGVDLPDLPNLRSHSVRNVLAHVEDHAMDWARRALSDSPSANLVGWMWGSGPSTEPVFRYLDIDTWEFRAGGRSCDLRGLVEETKVVSSLIPVHMEINIVRKTQPSVGSA